ncbi:hypothetical protein NQ314_013502 [Rhamnusium bicolor]|uniref:CLIP domain-containing serine protease n=1 Tax=Rhamnusium bicolor TaxID=1586634 RepID=A0AAV8X6P7_9CUCU|nr:hypothetical protein NQ314_013502 [Rhamnusium bicolor]
MATICETPNYDPGYCIEIRQCAILFKQLNNTKARTFLRQSQCGPQNENRLNPKVCCGKYNNFRNVSKNIAEEDKIFPKSCGFQRPVVRGRIVGGKEASLGEYPWMARFSVVLGEHNTETKIDCSSGGLFCAEARQISRAAKVIVHPDYNPESSGHYNDISIIHLNKGAQLSNFVQPICLLMDPSQVPARYYLSGWGKTETESSSKIKMKVEISHFDKTECKEKYSLLNIELKDSQICAGGEEQKDSCTGDSGGPLMMPTSNGTWYASGIVSYGIGCGLKGWPGVYTNIASFIPWIKKQIYLNSMISTRSNFKREHKRHNKTKVSSQIMN